MGTITHSKASGKPASADPTLIDGPAWDDAHIIAPGTINTTDLGDDITAAGKALLDDANAAAQLTTLGVTAYAQTLLDDANATTARGTLGLAAIAASGSGADLTAASIEDTKLATSANKGRWLARQIIAASGTYTPTTGASFAHLRGIGGGGGGGGATPGAGAGAGAGGSSGVLLDIWIGTAGVQLTGGGATCGAAGAAGSTAPGAGGAGGDSTIVINSVTYTMKGGAGGAAMTGVAGNGAALPTAPAAGTSSGGFTSYGLGGAGTVDDGTAWKSGNGGGTDLGAGGVCVGSTTAGNAGNGMGGGGSGAAAQSGARAGGAGAAGGFVIDEYT